MATAFKRGFDEPCRQAVAYLLDRLRYPSQNLYHSSTRDAECVAVLYFGLGSSSRQSTGERKEWNERLGLGPDVNRQRRLVLHFYLDLEGVFVYFTRPVLSYRYKGL